MSNKDISKKGNNSPELLENKDLDQVNGGGYTEVEWTYSKSATESNNNKLAPTKDKKGIVATSGNGSI
jgi:hypothetical protein